MIKFYATPNHSLKSESDDYKYFYTHMGPNFQTSSDYIAWWSAQLFNTGFILKLELFQKNDLPESEMTIKANPSVAMLKDKIITKLSPPYYNGPQMEYYHHLSDWDIKIENKTGTHYLKAEHKNDLLDKGLYLTFRTDSIKGSNYALLGTAIWIALAAGLYFSGLGFWKSLGIDVIIGLGLYFMFSKIINQADNKTSKDNEVLSFFKKYLATNFDLIEIKENN